MSEETNQQEPQYGRFFIGISGLNRWSRHTALRFCGTLIMEMNEFGEYVLSLGRISFLILLLLGVGIWTGYITPTVNNGDLPTWLGRLIITMAGYNFAKKVTGSFNNWQQAKVDVADAKADIAKSEAETNPVEFKQGDGPS